MRRLLPPLVLILASSAASASVGLYSLNPQLDSVVRPGTLVTFNFEPFVNDVDEHDVTVDFSTAYGTIESISGDQFTCTASGSSARCTRALFPKNTVGPNINVAVRMPATGVRLEVHGTIRAASGSTATWNPWVFVANPFYVTNTASDGAGSFRDAIARANASCPDRQHPCEIDFQVSGEINLDAPLPEITARKIAINPENQIVLDGRGLDSAGLTISSEDLTLSRLEIVNWGGPGLLLIGQRATISDSEFRQNLRGVMASGTGFLYLHDNVISDNRLSGVWLENAYYPAVYENTIENNGASGVYVGRGSSFGMVDENTIRGNRDFGVGVSPQARWTEIRGNSMKANGQLGIDFELDLVTPNVADDSTRPVPNAPVLTSATYDARLNKTTIIGHVELRKPADVGYYNALVDLYASSTLDAHGMAQGEKPLNVRSDYGNGVGINPTTHDFVFTYDGDLRGQYITATSTRMYALGKGVTANALQPRPQYYENWQQTSEMSNPVRVE